MWRSQTVVADTEPPAYRLADYTRMRRERKDKRAKQLRFNRGKTNAGFKCHGGK